MVPNQDLHRTLELLDGFYAASDPFSTGLVSSLYFDSSDRKCFNECASGALAKHKFRLRTYNSDAKTANLQIKSKYLSAVRKFKLKTDNLDLSFWPSLAKPAEFAAIKAQYGELQPVLAIDYMRHRYRSADIRFTLDTNIKLRSSELAPLSFKAACKSSAAFLPFSIFEIKTNSERPYLPFYSLLNLKQVSFSKYYLAACMLEGDTDILNKYI